MQKTLFADFGDSVIIKYTRTDAIADGVLVDVSETAREAGSRLPVAMTQTAWLDCVTWTDTDSRRQVYQDTAGRLWDVLWMAFVVIRRASRITLDRSDLEYQFYRVPRDGKSVQACLTTLRLVIGPGDEGEPVVTIMLPGED